MKSDILGVWLNQTDAASALGISVASFIREKVKFSDNAKSGHKKKYFIPISKMIPEKKKQYDGLAGYAEVEDNSDAINELVASVDFSGEKQALDISQARRRKIIKETEFLDQKIRDKKEQIFIEWSDRFFEIFAKSFTKFKNSLIDLRLKPQQLQVLNENLDFAIKSMQLSLDDIYSNFIEDEQTEQE